MRRALELGLMAGAAACLFRAGIAWSKTSFEARVDWRPGVVRITTSGEEQVRARWQAEWTRPHDGRIRVVHRSPIEPYL